MSSLPTRDDLLRRREHERSADERRRQRTLAIERDLVAARRECWELVTDFVTRAGELGIEPRIWRASGRSPHTAKISWIAGYPLTNGAVVSAPPHRYCISERRTVFRPGKLEREIDEISYFTVPAGCVPEDAADVLEQHTPTNGEWPRIAKLEHASTILDALRKELELSLFALMD